MEVSSPNENLITLRLPPPPVNFKIRRASFSAILYRDNSVDKGSIGG